MTTMQDLCLAFEPSKDPSWVLSEDGDDPLRESSRETRFAISNGLLGVRGAEAINRQGRGGVPPRTYVAGLFESPDAESSIPELVPAADWLQVRILLDGQPLAIAPAGRSSKNFTLDMKRGLVLTDWRRWDGAAGAARLRTLRLVSAAERAIGLQLFQLTIEDGGVEVWVEARLDGVRPELVAEQRTSGLDVWRTPRSGKTLAVSAMAALQIDGVDLAPTALDPFGWIWRWTSRAGQVADFTRMVAFQRGDAGDADPGPRAGVALAASRQTGWPGLLSAHEVAWAGRSMASDVEVEGDDDAQRALRFALYHLNGAANPADDHVSVGARALTGDDYHGHVFWDTEIYLLPFYTLTWPEAARALLMYRFRTLDAARSKAMRMGWRGALYAWESADTGAEATPAQVVGPDRKVVNVLCGTEEQHISADIAYAVWRYWLATGDEGFLRDAGAEILLETGRFWASRVQREPDGFGHIRGVIGPDEYHEAIDDNAYTNVMARWNIHRALEVADLLRERWPKEWARLSASLTLNDAERVAWGAAADSLVTGLDPATGLYEQFAGFFDLEDIDLAAYAGRSAPMDVVLGRERAQQSQVVKQADVVALLALLPHEFPPGADTANFRYYEPRCGHGSSLSAAMHGLVAARLGESAKGLDYFRRTSAIDLADTHVAIAGGIHIAALGGVWMTAVLGFAGVALRDDGVSLDPQLPAAWQSLAFPIQWRGRHLRVRIDATTGQVDVDLMAGGPMTVVVRGEAHAIGESEQHFVTSGRA